MAGNGRTIALKNADIEVTDGTEVHGYTFPKGTRITEGRGNSFTAAVSQGAPTRRDSQPYQLYALEDFGGGFGQVSANSVTGGAGQGGQPNRFFDGKCWTLSGGKIMPGLARQLISPTGTPSPVPDNQEMPRGVLPAQGYPYFNLAFTHDYTTYFRPTSTVANVTKLNVLVAVDVPGSYTLTALLIDNFTLTSINLSATVTLDNTDFKWITLTSTGGSFTLTSGNPTGLSIYTSDNLTLGCYAGLDTNLDTLTDRVSPYFQVLKPTTTITYREWANNIYGVYNLFAGVNFQVVLTSGPTNSGLFSAFNPAAAERTFAAYTVMSALVFDNKLYAGFNGATPRTDMWNATDAALVAVPTSTSNTGLNNLMAHEGTIYCTDVAGSSLFRWDGTYPIVVGTNAVQIIAVGKIGKPTTNGRNAINNLVMYQGHIWVFKPEGIFRIFADPKNISVSEVPRVLQVWGAGGLEHIDNGKFVCEHQGMLYFNVRNRLYQIGIGQGGQPVVTTMVPPFSRGRYRTNPYITGITSDGVVLYVSYDNVGVKAFDSRGWHDVTDFYNPATTEGGRSGLAFLVNPGGTTDLLYAGDGKQLVKLALPNILTGYSTQIFQENQNKCMWFASSILDFDLANVPKFFRSVALYGSSKGWNWKVVGSYYQSGDPSYRTIIEKGINEGLFRDKWVSPSTNIGISAKVITKLMSGGGETATAGPGNFVPADFQNAYQGSEKRASNDDVANPVSAVAMSFILYGWRSDGAVPAAGTYIDVAYIEDIVVKYWATLEYLGTWQLTIDLQALYKTTDFKDPLSLAQARADVNWLRGRIKAQTPTRWTFKWVGGTTITIESPAYSPQWLGEGGTPISDTQWDVARQVSFRLVDTTGV
jgi:hypothetical protein